MLECALGCESENYELRITFCYEELEEEKLDLSWNLEILLQNFGSTDLLISVV